jgi:hypothetical protein
MEKGRFFTKEDGRCNLVYIDSVEYAISCLLAFKLQAIDDGNWRKVGSLHLEHLVHDAHSIDLLLAELFIH